MIEAYLKGKLGRDCSRAHDRSEDLLTSTVFGLLRYLPNDQGLLPALASARLVGCKKDEAGLLIVCGDKLSLRGSIPQITFWPSMKDFGESDILVELQDSNGTTQDAAIVEAKLNSPKSSEADIDEDPVEDRPDPDQLVRYWQALLKKYPERQTTKTLIYLTSHSAPPIDELAASLERCPDMRLAWLSWRDVWRALEPCTALPAVDLKTLLEHHGFKPFSGFPEKPIAVPAKGFWRKAGWFVVQAHACPAAGFWRTAQ